MLSTIAIAVFILLAVLLVIASTKPATFRVRRTATIKAPPERIFPLLNDFHSWGVWSPWENREPAMKRTHSGAASGKGAVYEWEGKKVGTGRMEILESVPSSKITIKLDFIKPFEGHNVAEFTLEPAGGSTNIAWDMRGANRFIGKVMQLFMNMDTMIGKDFEAGFANLKAATEK